MKLSLAVTTYNRFDLTIQSFAKVIEDERIDDVVLLDDASTDSSYEKLRDHFAGNEKVRVLRQLTNQNMSRNKRDATSYCKNSFAILFDSDNVLDSSYLDALEAVGELQPDTIYCPCAARPNFIFEKFSGRTFDRHSVKEVASDPMGNCSLNCCNYVVPVKSYVDIYEFNPEMKATDTVFFSYLWLKAGYKFHIVKGMGYDHLNHPGSGFLQDLDYNMKKSEEVRKLILSL